MTGARLRHKHKSKRESHMNRFKGIFPAIITPMTADGSLNEDAFRQVMEFNIQAGVQGFWVAGGTGESILLDDAENRRIAEISADQSQGRIANIMHVGAPTTTRSARLAEHAAKAGVEAICLRPALLLHAERQRRCRTLSHCRRRRRPSLFRLQSPRRHRCRDYAGSDGQDSGARAPTGRAQTFRALHSLRKDLCRNGPRLS